MDNLLTIAKKPVIDLPKVLGEGIGLIIPWPSGIIYYNQAGGLACIQAKIEGFFIPLDTDFFRPSRTEGRIIDDNSFDNSDSDDMDIFLNKYWGDGYSFRVDRSRLDLSWEAWVWITITGRFPPVEGIDVTEAVMVWGNSD